MKDQTLNSLESLYCTELSTHAPEAMLAKVQHGKPSGRLPLGYLFSNGTKEVEIDLLRAPYIIEAFEKVASGISLRQALEHITRLGLTKARNQPLSLSSLQALLTNPFYCGLIRYGGELYPGAHEPLVSKTLFNRVQRGLRKRRCQKYNCQKQIGRCLNFQII